MITRLSLTAMLSLELFLSGVLFELFELFEQLQLIAQLTLLFVELFGVDLNIIRIQVILEYGYDAEFERANHKQPDRTVQNGLVGEIQALLHIQIVEILVVGKGIIPHEKTLIVVRYQNYGGQHLEQKVEHRLRQKELLGGQFKA